MATLETVKVMRDSIEVTINKSDLHLEKEQPKQKTKKESKKSK